jgi:hypothetical protein
LNFSYKIAVKISKILIFIQTKDNFDENSTWRTFKYSNHENCDEFHLFDKKYKNLRQKTFFFVLLTPCYQQVKSNVQTFNPVKFYQGMFPLLRQSKKFKK